MSTAFLLAYYSFRALQIVQVLRKHRLPSLALLLITSPLLKLDTHTRFQKKNITHLSSRLLGSSVVSFYDGYQVGQALG